MTETHPELRHARRAWFATVLLAWPPPRPSYDALRAIWRAGGSVYDHVDARDVVRRLARDTLRREDHADRLWARACHLAATQRMCAECATWEALRLEINESEDLLSAWAVEHAAWMARTKAEIAAGVDEELIEVAALIGRLRASRLQAAVAR